MTQQPIARWMTQQPPWDHTPYPSMRIPTTDTTRWTIGQLGRTCQDIFCQKFRHRRIMRKRHVWLKCDPLEGKSRARVPFLIGARLKSSPPPLNGTLERSFTAKLFLPGAK